MKFFLFPQMRGTLMEKVRRRSVDIHLKSIFKSSQESHFKNSGGLNSSKYIKEIYQRKWNELQRSKVSGEVSI